MNEVIFFASGICALVLSVLIWRQRMKRDRINLIADAQWIYLRSAIVFHRDFDGKRRNDMWDLAVRMHTSLTKERHVEALMNGTDPWAHYPPEYKPFIEEAKADLERDQIKF